ncbi:MAG: hypothetical protein HY000_06480 [Planctomycetes bacterium]|nr:hypothetical protein [Planctomycetota bacterium]
MKSWHIVCCGVVALAASGCRSNANYEPLYTEMRWLEDRIYGLQDHLDQAESELEACHRENLTLRKRLADAGVPEDLGPSAPVTAPLPPPPRAPLETLPPDRLAPPQVDGVPAPGDSEMLRIPDADQSSTGRGPPQPARIAAGSTARSAASGNSLQRITLNRVLTGGYDRDGVPGDEALMVVVEPRSASGEIIDTPGDISVVVLDPALDGPAARVARWDITAAESAELFRETPVGQGVQLELPWPDKPPTSRALMLFVRYSTAEGGKHVADQQIEVNPPGTEVTARPAAADVSPPGGAAKPHRPQWTPYR